MPVMSLNPGRRSGDRGQSARRGHAAPSSASAAPHSGSAQQGDLQPEGGAAAANPGQRKTKGWGAGRKGRGLAAEAFRLVLRAKWNEVGAPRPYATWRAAVLQRLACGDASWPVPATLSKAAPSASRASSSRTANPAPKPSCSRPVSPASRPSSSRPVSPPGRLPPKSSRPASPPGRPPLKKAKPTGTPAPWHTASAVPAQAPTLRTWAPPAAPQGWQPMNQAAHEHGCSLCRLLRCVVLGECETCHHVVPGSPKRGTVQPWQACCWIRSRGPPWRQATCAAACSKALQTAPLMARPMQAHQAGGCVTLCSASPCTSHRHNAAFAGFLVDSQYHVAARPPVLEQLPAAQRC